MSSSGEKAYVVEIVGGDDDKAAVENDVAQAADAVKGIAFLHAAQFYFVNGFFPECLGDLQVAISDQPSLATSPAVKVLRGACNAT